MRILLTNDDSHRSPLLELLVAELSARGEVTLVVPRRQQSWKGKSITCFEYLHVEPITIAGVTGYSVDGTPADCVNLGIHNLCPAKPDLIVSGINAGLNTGSGFIFSSGTVGACFEANIAGIPAIAFSQAFSSEMASHFASENDLPPQSKARLLAECRRNLLRILALFERSSKLLTGDITWNVNFPVESTPETQIKVTSVARSTYGALFAPEGAHYRYQLKQIFRDLSPGCDAEAIIAGHISVTPIGFRDLGQLPADQIQKLQRFFS